MNIASALSRPVSLNHGTGHNAPPSSGFDRPAPPPSPCRTCSDPFAFSAIRRRMFLPSVPVLLQKTVPIGTPVSFPSPSSSPYQWGPTLAVAGIGRHRYTASYRYGAPFPPLHMCGPTLTAVGTGRHIYTVRMGKEKKRKKRTEDFPHGAPPHVPLTLTTEYSVRSHHIP